VQVVTSFVYNNEHCKGVILNVVHFHDILFNLIGIVVVLSYTGSSFKTQTSKWDSKLKPLLSHIVISKGGESVGHLTNYRQNVKFWTF
jgi:hypothetical protein